MGRFKIYDPLTLVDSYEDSMYATCLECNKKLKNIMGNIKRHYERVHNKVFSQYKSRKSSKKHLKNHNKLKDNKPNIMKKRGRPERKFTGKSDTCLINIMEDIQNKPSALGTRQSNRIFEQLHKVNINSTPEKTDLQHDATISIGMQEHDIIANTTKDVKEHEALTPKPKETKSKTKHQNIEANLEPTAEQSNSSPLQQIKKVQTVSLNMDRQEYLQCIAETVTELNMPLKYFDDDKVFQKLLQPWTRAFGIQINSQTIMEHINDMAIKLRANITNAVGCRFICLKLDIVSKNERSIMVLNIQFIRDFVLKVFTIGVLELLDDHYATYLKQQILNILERYQIDIGKVYSITKDNDSNVKKSVKILQEFKENDIADDENENFYDELSHEPTQNLSDQFVGHSLHFVAYNIINQLNENLSQSRDAVKCLRNKMLELNINPLPILDNTTRWSSTYEMVKTLLKARQYVEHNQQINVEVDWEFARKFEESFKPVVETIMMLQSNQLLIGDFYREWLVCETDLEYLSESNELALYLLEALRIQKEKLMDNETFLAALYLDQRFCFRGSTYLSDKQKKTAIFHLLIIFNKLKSSMEIAENDVESSSCPKIIIDSENERYIKLERKAAENTNIKIETRSFAFNENANLTDVDCSWAEGTLEKLQYEEKLTFNTNILSYWKTKSNSNCILAKIAEIVLAVPATQVTIKRAFSALPLVLTKQKRNLNSETLESILLLKLNPELSKKISFD